jgi:zinc transporter 7
VTRAGDFAILLQSGFSRRQAMMAQFATAVGAFMGCLLGVLLEHGLGNTTHYILPFTGTPLRSHRSCGTCSC